MCRRACRCATASVRWCAWVSGWACVGFTAVGILVIVIRVAVRLAGPSGLRHDDGGRMPITDLHYDL